MDQPRCELIDAPRLGKSLRTVQKLVVQQQQKSRALTFLASFLFAAFRSSEPDAYPKPDLTSARSSRISRCWVGRWPISSATPSSATLTAFCSSLKSKRFPIWSLVWASNAFKEFEIDSGVIMRLEGFRNRNPHWGDHRTYFSLKGAVPCWQWLNIDGSQNGH